MVQRLLDPRRLLGEKHGLGIARAGHQPPFKVLQIEPAAALPSKDFSALFAVTSELQLLLNMVRLRSRVRIFKLSGHREGEIGVRLETRSIIVGSTPSNEITFQL
jgi:hypothetical protein